MIFPMAPGICKSQYAKQSLGVRLVEYLTSSLLQTQASKVKQDGEPHTHHKNNNNNNQKKTPAHNWQIDLFVLNYFCCNL